MSPLIKLLKQIRRANRYSAYNRNDDGTDATASATAQAQAVAASSSSNNNNNYNTNRDPVVTTDFLGQRPQSSSSNNNDNRYNSNSNSFSSPEQIQKIIQQSQQSSSSSSSASSFIPGLGNLGNLPSASGTSVPPQRISEINRGVSTILSGVGSGSLERILRGSFQFTR